MRLALFCLLVPCIVWAAPTPSPVPVTLATAPPATVESARKLLDEALTARNPDARKAAVEALGLIGPREPYMSRLMSMLEDKDVEVRVAAISSLVDLHDKSTLPAIRHAYDDPVPEVSFAAAKALLAMGDNTGREALMDVVTGGDDTASGYVSTSGRAALRVFYAPKTAVPYLMARTIGFAHVAGLGAGVASLEGLLSDPNISGRASAVLLLGADKDPRVLPALRFALYDKDATIRAAAVHAIALRDDITLGADLAFKFEDKDVAVRTRAAAGWLRLQSIGAEAQAAALKATPPQAPGSNSRHSH